MNYGEIKNFDIANGEGVEVTAVTNDRGYIDVALVKKLDTYQVYVAGTRMAVGTVDVPQAVTETLLLGAQWDGSGNVFRQSQVDMPVFEIWQGVMTQDEIVQHFAEI